MKRTMSAIAAVLIMAALVWLGRDRSRTADPASPGASPGGQPGVELLGAAERVEGLLADAGRGDVAAYLAAFRGPVRVRLEQQADERGRSAFADELRRTARARKGHATFEPEPDGDDTGAVRVTVESTFADHVERQTFRLVRDQVGWVIADVETARDHVPRDAPGSTADYNQPEGPPVPAPADESVGEP